MGSNVTFTRPDGQSVQGYLAEAPGAVASVVVIQEWWGLNDQIRGVAERFAQAGYTALVPDLYRGRATVEAEEAHHLMSSLNFGDAASQDVRGAAQFLKARGGKVGVTGYCMGGALTVLSSMMVPEMDAGVVWYGLPPLEFVDAAKIRVPLLAHWATQDAAFAIDTVDQLEARLTAAGANTPATATSPSTPSRTRPRSVRAGCRSPSTTRCGRRSHGIAPSASSARRWVDRGRPQAGRLAPGRIDEPMSASGQASGVDALGVTAGLGGGSEVSPAAGLGRRLLLTLLAVFSLACLFGYLAVRHAVNTTVESQALAIAEVVASQATTARSVYAMEIAAKLAREGLGPHVESEGKPGFVPIPAQFLKLVGKASSENAHRLYQYKPVSRWNLEPSQGLDDEFLRWAWPQLEAQDQPNPAGPIPWKAVSRIETREGRRVLRYLSADPASQPACASCHNAYETRPEIIARRVASGVAPGKHWEPHQLMGALSVTIPLDKAELLAGDQINQTTLLIASILIASFAALSAFAWRLSTQDRELRDAALRLRRSSLENQAAQALLEAQRGVERAFTELSSYMQAIDQHAIVSVGDRTGRIIDVNDQLVRISGYSREELIGRNHRILSSGVHPREFFTRMWQSLTRGEVWRGVICNRSKSGALYWVDAAIVPMRNAEGEVERYISIRIDITERKQFEQEMLRLATHDSLTGLVNRALLRDRIHQALESAHRNRHRAAVLFIDLDQFKAVNDSLGHTTGDRLLVEVGNRLASSVRAEDTVARQGGDEFIVFIPKLDSPQAAGLVAQSLHAMLSQPFSIDGQEVFVGSSIGIALYPDDGGDVDTLLRHSDTAMYQVKESGRNHWMYFTAQMNVEAVERYALTNELRRAAERGELVLHFQPIFEMGSMTLDSLEVLLRWQHPTRGLVPPAQFIGLAEASGLIVPIGEWVLRAACQQIDAWRREGLQPPRLALNLSSIQVRLPGFGQRVAEMLDEYRVAPSSIAFEITEGTLMSKTDEVLATLRQLSELGMRLAIDDFGTGFSSLNYLKTLPIDTLKIDRSFVTDISDDPDDAAIVIAVLSMARGLQLEVIAEGVETERQLEFLRAHGCRLFQGFRSGSPMPPEAIARLLRPA